MRAGRRQRWESEAWVALLLLLASCVVGGAARSVLPPPPGAVQVKMREYAFDYSKAIAPGRVVFRVTNVGRLSHSLTLVSLPEEFPPLDEQLHSDTRRAAATIARLPARSAGSTGTFAVDLQPGRYGLVCFVQDDDGIIHALKGMNSEFRVA